MIKSLLLLFFLTIVPLNSRYQSQNVEVNDIQTKVMNLLNSMTLDEKIGQMTQVDYKAFNDLNEISTLFIGSVLWGGGSDVGNNQPDEWSKMSDSLIQYSLKTRLGIPLLLGIDAVHGNNNIDGAVIFPHNIGLGCSRNPELVEQIARITAKEVVGSGIHWTFAPCVAVARDERWGRTFESYSENPEFVAKLGAAAVRGLESNDLTQNDAVLSCTKHFIGDGGTEKGDDQGNTQ